METVRLANTELVISRIGFGCGPLGGTDWGHFDQREAMAAVSRAVDLGITFFDTADVYGLGRSERLLSEALGERRHDVVIASKCGVNWEESGRGDRARTFYDSSPQRLVEALENSLRRLRVDTIPLYFIHWPDPNTPLTDTVATLLRCQEAGKIQHIGLSNFSPAQIREVSKNLRVAAVQMQYSLIDRRVEKDVLPCCDELGISAIAYGSLAQGFLTGKYDSTKQFGADDCRSRLDHFQGKVRDANTVIVDRLRTIGSRCRKSPAQIAMRWVLENPGVAGIIAGTRSTTQAEHNVGAQGWDLTPTNYEYLLSG